MKTPEPRSQGGSEATTSDPAEYGFSIDQPTQEAPNQPFGESPGHSPMEGTGAAGKWILGALTLAIVAGLVVWLVPPIRERVFGASSDQSHLVTQPAKRGPFRVAVVERGTVSSLKNSTLSSNVEGSTTIISIVPEGTNVKAPVKSRISGYIADVQISGEHQNVIVESDPVLINNPFVLFHLPGRRIEHQVATPPDGYTRVLVSRGDRVNMGDNLGGDVVCELDSSVLDDKEQGQQILVTQALADLEKSRKNVEIQISQNVSDLATAQLALDIAQLDLTSFVEGERAQLVNEQKGLVLIAQDTLTTALETYEFNKQLAKQGFSSLADLEKFRVQMVKARTELAAQREKLKVLENFTARKTMKERDEAVAEGERELKRVQLQGQAALAQWEAELRARQLTYSVEVEKLERLQRQIKACKLVAPQDGKVVYANQESRREEVVIEEGTAVRERQKIITLPDFTRMKVDVKIHESKVNNVREGLRAEIRVDAIPGRTFAGVVETVPDVPVKGGWPNRDLMLFETTVRIEGDVAGLKPGMNAEVELIAEERENVLQIPIQAIIDLGDGYACYVLTSDGPELRRDIEIGSSNAKTVEIISGLEAGEQVVLNKTVFESEIAALRDAVSKSKAETAAKDASESEAKTTPKPLDLVKQGSGKKQKPKKKKPKAKGKSAGGDWFKRIDADGDGVVTPDEAVGPMKDNFESIDLNKDGKIDRSEFAGAAAKFGKKRPPGAGSEE